MNSPRSLQLALWLSKQVSQFIFDDGNRCFRPGSMLSRLSSRFSGQPIAVARAVPGPNDAWWNL
jgi:hypothetical protein